MKATELFSCRPTLGQGSVHELAGVGAGNLLSPSLRSRKLLGAKPTSLASATSTPREDVLPIHPALINEGSQGITGDNKDWVKSALLPSSSSTARARLRADGSDAFSHPGGGGDANGADH